MWMWICVHDSNVFAAFAQPPSHTHTDPLAAVHDCCHHRETTASIHFEWKSNWKQFRKSTFAHTLTRTPTLNVSACEIPSWWWKSRMQWYAMSSYLYKIVGCARELHITLHCTVMRSRNVISHQPRAGQYQRNLIFQFKIKIKISNVRILRVQTAEPKCG